MSLQLRFATAAAALLLIAALSPGSQIIRGSVKTELVPAGAVEYPILLPDGPSSTG